jgi:hypothetical protein
MSSRICRSGRDQPGGELVEGRPGSGCVAVPSGGGVEAQTGLASDPIERVVNVPCCRRPGLIRRDEQRLGVVGAGGATRELLRSHRCLERWVDPVAARERRADARDRAEGQLGDLTGVRPGRGRERAGGREMRLDVAAQLANVRLPKGRELIAIRAPSTTNVNRRAVSLHRSPNTEEQAVPRLAAEPSFATFAGIGAEGAQRC